jgi:hypothetical protein
MAQPGAMEGMTMTMLARTANVNSSAKFTSTEITIAGTPTFNVPDKHLIKVTTCWRSMSSTVSGDIVTLSITDDANAHKQEQNHRIDTADQGQAGGEMSRVLKVLATGGDVTPGSHSFKLRAVRAFGTGTIVIQAAKTFPTEIRVEDLGNI